jgi:hypothetical protein
LTYNNAHVPRLSDMARIALFVVVVAAIVVGMFATGLAGNKAEPGGGGRVPIPTAAPDSR